MQNLSMVEVQGHRWISAFGSSGARSWGLECSCGFEMGLTEPFSIDHRQLTHSPTPYIETCQM